MTTRSTGAIEQGRAQRIQNVVEHYGVLVPPKTFITETEVKLYLAHSAFGWGIARARVLLGLDVRQGCASLSLVEEARIKYPAFDRLITKLETAVITRRVLGGQL